MPKTSVWKLTWSPRRQLYECVDCSAPRRRKRHLAPDDHRRLQGWLERIPSCAFAGRIGTYTARKERNRSGNSYWYAYRRNGKQVQKRYLGKSDSITTELMERVAELFVSTGTDAAAEPSIAPDEQPALWDDGWDPILAAKLRPPLLPPYMLARPRLFEQLCEALVRPVTLVSAAAGSGKSTLLSSWLSQLATGNVKFAWMTLDRDDDEPERFWRLVFAAFERLCPGSGEGPLVLLRSGRELHIERMLVTMLNRLEAIEGQMALVLDDYQVVTDASISRGMAFLLEHLPSNVHVIITTRIDPPLPLTRLRLHERLLELRDADLLLTAAETRAYLAVRVDQQITSQESDLLYARTQGWFAGVALVALLIRQGGAADGIGQAWNRGRQDIADYLVQEVLQQLPENVQQFLLRTSILDRLQAQLCEVVAGQANGRETLDRLWRANLFLSPLDSERRWYRYHQLFAATLQEQLRHTEPGLVTDLHRRALHWFAERGMVADAIGHAREIGDVETIAMLAETTGIDMIKRNKVSSIMHWVNLLPRATLFAHPILVVYVCWNLISTNRFGIAAEMLDEYAQIHHLPPLDTADVEELERCISSHMSARAPKVLDDRGIGPHIDRFLRLYATLALLRDDRASFSKQLTERAAHYLPASQPAQVGDSWLDALWQGDVFGAIARLEDDLAAMLANTRNLLGFSIVSTLTHLLFKTGQLYKIAHICDLVLQSNRTANVRMHYGPSLVALGLVAYERNNLERAEEHLRQGVELCRQFENVESFLAGLFGLVRLRARQGDEAGARNLLHENENMVRSIGEESADLTRSMRFFRAQIALALGEYAEAGHWTREMGLTPYRASRLDPLLEDGYLMQARLSLASARWQEADRLLSWLHDGASRQQRRGSLLTIAILRSLLERERGNQEAALAALGTAVSHGQMEGYVRAFVDKGAPMYELLDALRRDTSAGTDHHVALQYLDRLLSLLYAEQAGQCDGGLAEPLTRRELEVLHLVSEGCSNGDIARRLVITDATVKSHLNTIYSKLQIHSRTQAIARARDLRLLS